jgi:hypothetical protein
MSRAIVRLTGFAAGCWLTGCVQAPVPDDPSKTPASQYLLLDTITCGKESIRIAQSDSAEFFGTPDQPPLLGDDTNEQQNLALNRGAVTCVKDTYYIKLGSSDTVILREYSNANEPEEFTRYTFLGRLGDWPYFVFACEQYGGSDYVLVHTKTGNQAVLWGEPLFSPGGRYLFCSSYELDAGLSENGMQLFRSDSTGLSLLWKKEPQLWGPINPRWSGDSLVYFMQEVPDRDLGRVSFYYAKVRVK